jgi:hypothetical protein
MKAHGVQPDLEVFNIMLGVCGAVDVTLVWPRTHPLVLSCCCLYDFCSILILFPYCEVVLLSDSTHARTLVIPLDGRGVGKYDAE